ncbi:hypothetical protein H6504_01470 [Candidatus Woesearchaeota archaeon]|nr:hypothetical protein [Candidatus Woesearchaeota archaeon]
MDNKNLGIIIIIAALLFAGIVFAFHQALDANAESSCTCGHADGEVCPMDDQFFWQTYAGVFIVGLILALGIYLIFFDKSQKEVARALRRHEHKVSAQEKFDILMLALSKEEKDVMKAVKEQDGITQQTLRLRTGLHKSKLSITIDQLVKKKLLVKEAYKKTNKIHLKV